jgi:hypothetical protein
MPFDRGGGEIGCGSRQLYPRNTRRHRDTHVLGRQFPRAKCHWRPVKQWTFRARLRSGPLENGNICVRGQRFQPFARSDCAYSGTWRRTTFVENRLFTGFSPVARTQSQVERLAGWRRSADRTRLRPEFPANREFFREFYVCSQADEIQIQKLCIGGPCSARFPAPLNRENDL